MITEGDIWHALEKSDLDYHEWVARKEFIDGKPYLHLFIELKTVTHVDTKEIISQINSALREVNADYINLEEMLGYRRLIYPCSTQELLVYIWITSKARVQIWHTPNHPT